MHVGYAYAYVHRIDLENVYATNVLQNWSGSTFT